MIKISSQESSKLQKIKEINFKEIVNAILGITIIITILVLLYPSLSKSPVDESSAQSIFAILGGWGGVILGYYFGRTPSEKVASQAQKVANMAEESKKSANITTKETLQSYQELLNDYNSKIEQIEKLLNQL